LLFYEQRKRVDIYIKHYTMIPLQVGRNDLGYIKWEVYYMIRFIEKHMRPLYMKLASCKTKQLAAVKLSEIEDYIADDMDNRK